MKKLKYWFILLLVGLIAFEPINTYAVGNVQGYWGYSIPNPHAHYFTTYPYNWNGWRQGQWWLQDNFAFDTYSGVRISQINFNSSSDNDVNTSAYSTGRQIVYLLTRNCVIEDFGNDSVGNHWRAESVSTSQLSYLEGYTGIDEEPRDLIQIVYRNQTTDTEIPAHIPINLWCGNYQGSSSGVTRPMVNLLTVGIYGDTDVIDYSQQLEEIKEAIENNGDISAVVNQQQITNQKLDTVNNSIQQQTEQQQDQYEQEKEEEAEREEQGQDDANTLGSLFSFTAFNPFSGIFGLFTGGGNCVPIPTVAAMLNSPETTFCPFFPANIRSIATPVMGISAMMLIFGFFIRWLNDGSFDGAIEV